MANTPKKMKDPTEAALSAIQDALQIPGDDKAAQPSISIPPSSPADSAAEKPWPGLRSKPTKAPETLKNAPVPYEDESLRGDDGVRRPANDDRESIGSILRALQQTPSRTSYVLASVFAAVWIVAGFGLGFLYIPEMQRALGPTGLTAPVLAVLAAIYLAPVVLFYVLAHMAMRSQEMRLVAQFITGVAMRIRDVGTVASDSMCIFSEG